VSDRLVVLADGTATPFAPPYDRGAVGMAMAGGAGS
jgi:simple sugar transport system ATP-binding protein